MDKQNIMPSITLDEEFENLIKPLSDTALHRLEFITMTNGSAKVRTWQNIILCDSNLYKICRRHRISCEVVNKGFANRNEALSYVCTEELKREDLTYEYKKYLIGKLFNLEMRSANSLKITKLSIATKLGETYLISAGAVQKYGQYTDAVDHLFGVAAELARYVLEGSLRISHDNTIELARFSKEELKTILQIAKEKSAGRMTFADLKHEIRWKNYTTTSRTRPKIQKDENVEIKKMPAYDPDADIMSMAMTIPSWIKALKRSVEHTDILATTEKGRESFTNQLYALDDAVINAIRLMEV